MCQEPSLVYGAHKREDLFRIRVFIGRIIASRNSEDSLGRIYLKE